MIRIVSFITTLLALESCNRRIAPPQKSASSPYMLIINGDISDEKLAISKCSSLCAGQTAYWNGYWADSNPFDTNGGICECIAADDPFPGTQPELFTLDAADVENTYGDIDSIKNEIHKMPLALREGSNESTKTAGSNSSVSAGNGQASARAGTATSKAGDEGVTTGASSRRSESSWAHSASGEIGSRAPGSAKATASVSSTKDGIKVSANASRAAGFGNPGASAGNQVASGKAAGAANAAADGQPTANAAFEKSAPERQKTAAVGKSSEAGKENTSAGSESTVDEVSKSSPTDEAGGVGEKGRTK